MLLEEALWIRKIISPYLPQLNSALDVGSSTQRFRTVQQPHIYNEVFQPIEQRKIIVSYMDKKKDNGIDIEFDISVDNAKNLNKQFDLVICTNLLEHVIDVSKVCQNLYQLLSKNGFLVLTVPYQYRYHEDPIDTMYRPSINELISLFPDFETVISKTIVVNDKSKYNFWKLSEIIKYYFPPFRWKVSAVLFRKP